MKIRNPFKRSDAWSRGPRFRAERSRPTTDKGAREWLQRDRSLERRSQRGIYMPRASQIGAGKAFLWPQGDPIAGRTYMYDNRGTKHNRRGTVLCAKRQAKKAIAWSRERA